MRRIDRREGDHPSGLRIHSRRGGLSTGAGPTGELDPPLNGFDEPEPEMGDEPMGDGGIPAPAAAAGFAGPDWRLSFAWRFSSTVCRCRID